MDKSKWKYRNFENCIEKIPHPKQLKTSECCVLILVDSFVGIPNLVYTSFFLFLDRLPIDGRTEV